MSIQFEQVTPSETRTYTSQFLINNREKNVFYMVFLYIWRWYVFDRFETFKKLDFCVMIHFHPKGTVLSLKHTHTIRNKTYFFNTAQVRSVKTLSKNKRKF